MEKYRPTNVQAAIESGDKEKVIAFAKAGGKATKEKHLRNDINKTLDAEMHEESMQSAADERRDDLLPEDA